jgi:SAM-dependent methyltransferase
MSVPSTGQDPRIAEQNSKFFAENADYARQVEQLTTYRNIRAAIDREVDGVDRLLDIGNGGVFDYDVHRVKELVGVDLFLDEEAPTDLPPHVVLRQGDALALPEPDASYDAVLFALVFHHLTGTTPEDLVANVGKALDEARRVVKPGGRLIIVESCVPPWFYAAERALFKPLVLLSRTPLLGDHPPTLQVPADLLARLVADRFGAVRTEEIPVGRWILQFGRKWPTRLTAARPWLITGTAS